MKKNLQIIIQIAFLILFIFLVINGKVQIWMGLFLLGIVASLLLGRIYCGWACPINTVMIGVTWFKKKIRIKSFKIPQFFTKPWVRILALGLFFTAFIFIMKTGKKLPVLPVLFTLGILFTFFFPEKLWHRYLCPYGAIISFPAAKSRFKMSIDGDACNNCGVCLHVCPAKAVSKNDKHHTIIKNDCLICLECSKKCKQNAIDYIL